MRKALILGINGQDGSYLADILLSEGWIVHGLHRHSSADNLFRIRHLQDRLTLHRGDVTDPVSLARIVKDVSPEMIFNEADQDEVKWSFATPGYTAQVTIAAVMNLLEICRFMHPMPKVFQPLSATMFGDAPYPQTEKTPFNPLSPYACAKVATYHICRFYRQMYGMHVTTGILYNHDSVRRADGPLLQYIARTVVQIKRGRQSNLPIATPDELVDIGDAEEYMWAVYRLMDLKEPHDVIISSGRLVNVRSLAEVTLDLANLTYDLIVPNPSFHRADVKGTLFGNMDKLASLIYWRPKVTSHHVVRTLYMHHKEHLP